MKWLITGATSGIGEQLAKFVAAQGHSVIACGRNQKKLAELSALGIDTLAFNVNDLEQCKAALPQVTADVYVLNAGTCEYLDVQEFDSELVRRVFDTNFFGVVHCVEAIQANLLVGNQVVIVDSLARLLPFSRSQAYGASKAALHYFTQSMAVDLKSKNVSFVSVSPGFVSTPLTDKNTFSMPMKVSAEYASHAIYQGVMARKNSIYFPFIFSFMLRLLSILPSKAKAFISRNLS